MCLATEKCTAAVKMLHWEVLTLMSVTVRTSATETLNVTALPMPTQQWWICFESNSAVTPCSLKEKICSEGDLLYRFPSVHTFFKGLTPTGLIGLFPTIYGYKKLKGRACAASHSSQLQITAVECAIKCYHDNDCGSFVFIVSLVRTVNPITHLCYMNPVSCALNQANIDTVVGEVYSYFKTGTGQVNF